MNARITQCPSTYVIESNASGRTAARCEKPAGHNKPEHCFHYRMGRGTERWQTSEEDELLTRYARLRNDDAPSTPQ